MKFSYFVYIFIVAILIHLFSFGCTTVDVRIPAASVDSEPEIKIGTSSEIQGEYLLTSWQESAEEGFSIDFESGGEVKFLEIVKNALGVKRYDFIAFIANHDEIKAYIPALGIYEYKKNQNNFDMASMEDVFNKSWKEVARIKVPSDIRLIKVFRIPSTKAIDIFIAGENGVLYKTVISDTTKFLDVTDYGISEYEIEDSVNLTTIENDKINAILPIFSKESIFALLFSGTLIKVNINTLDVDQTYSDILWNGYVLTTRDTDAGIDIVAAGKHPVEPVIIYSWNEINEFKELKRVSIKEVSCVQNIFGTGNFILNTSKNVLLSDIEFTKVRVIEDDLGFEFSCVDFSDDLERVFINSNAGSYILGSKAENDDFVLTSKKLAISDMIPGFANGSQVLARFLNNTYLMIAAGVQCKLIRTKFDKQVEGSIEIAPGRDDEIIADVTPNYRGIEKYENLLEKIEECGDWEAMKAVYRSINKDFKPTGTYFPGYAGTAMRGGWIEDTLADLMKDREMIAALIMMYWNAEKKDRLLGENVTLLRKESLPIPGYLKNKQPLLALHRAIILKTNDPERMVNDFIEYLQLWGESFKIGYDDFDNLGIDDENIKELKELMLNFGLELFEYLPAPMRYYHKKLLAALGTSEFLSDLENLEQTLEIAKETFETRWISGK